MNKRLINVVVFVLTMIGVVVVSALINRIPHTAARDAIWNPITRPLELFYESCDCSGRRCCFNRGSTKAYASRRNLKQVDPA